MKRIYLLFIIVLIAAVPAVVEANVYYQNFGNGLVFDQGVNMPIDINNDQVVDFYVNPVMGELGFQPIFAVGCYATDMTEVTPGGSYSMTTYNDGEVIDYNEYFEESRPSSIAANGGPVAGWNDNEARYVGFMIFNTGSFGWMRIKMDAASNQLIVLEWAYRSDIQEITAGDRGANSIVETELSDLSVYPNPATENVNISLSSKSHVDVRIYNNLGQEVHAEIIPASSAVRIQNINVSDWARGQYIIRLQNSEAIVTRKLNITR